MDSSTSTSAMNTPTSTSGSQLDSHPDSHLDLHLKSTHISEEGLFTADLISPIIAASLPESYTIRALRESDYSRGYLDCLRVLTTVGDISEEQWSGRYEWMSTQGKGGYYLLVVDDGSRIVGTGALIVERKL